jgi:hypothetical protein
VAASICLQHAKALAASNNGTNLISKRGSLERKSLSASIEASSNSSLVGSAPGTAGAPRASASALLYDRSMLAREIDMCCLAYELFSAFGSVSGVREVVDFVRARLPLYLQLATDSALSAIAGAPAPSVSAAGTAPPSSVSSSSSSSSSSSVLSGFVEPLRAIVRVFATAEYDVAVLLFDFCLGNRNYATTTTNVTSVDVLLHVWDSIASVHRSVMPAIRDCSICSCVDVSSSLF